MASDQTTADLLRENGTLKEWLTVYRDEIKGILQVSNSATPEQRAAMIDRLEKLNAILR